MTANVTPDAQTIDLLTIPPGAGLAPPPPANMDPYLDAAAGCFLRFGVRRTSVQDIAAAMGVNRATVYRQVGNIDSIMRLLTAREVHRQLNEAYQRTNVDSLNPQGLVRLLAEMIRIVHSHPIVAKVLKDEPELFGGAVHPSTGVFTRIAAFITPALGIAMATGQIAERDPAVVAEWLARISATAILSPPPGDLETFLAELLVPALTPSSGGSSSGSN